MRASADRLAHVQKPLWLRSKALKASGPRAAPCCAASTPPAGRPPASQTRRSRRPSGPRRTGEAPRARRGRRAHGAGASHQLAHVERAAGVPVVHLEGGARVGGTRAVDSWWRLRWWRSRAAARLWLVAQRGAGALFDVDVLPAGGRAMRSSSASAPSKRGRPPVSAGSPSSSRRPRRAAPSYATRGLVVDVEPRARKGGGELGGFMIVGVRNAFNACGRPRRRTNANSLRCANSASSTQGTAHASRRALGPVENLLTAASG